MSGFVWFCIEVAHSNRFDEIRTAALKTRCTLGRTFRFSVTKPYRAERSDACVLYGVKLDWMLD